MNIADRVPEASSNQVCKLLSKTYPKDAIDIRTIGLGTSAITNIVLTCETLDILIKSKGNLILTQDGVALSRAIAFKRTDEIQNIFQKCVMKSSVLKYLYSLINEKKVLNNIEIGEFISNKFKKKWASPASYKRYGGICADLLSIAGFGMYSNGVYTIDKTKMFLNDKISSPMVTFNTLQKILRELVESDKNISSFPETFAKRNRLSGQLLNCLDLGLVEKKGDYFSISPKGLQLINPANDIVTRTTLFREILRESSYSKIIEIIQRKNIMDKSQIGDLVLFELKRKGSKQYKDYVGKTFINWIKAAGLFRDTDKTDIDNEETLIHFQSEENSFIEPTNNLESNNLVKIGIMIERIENKINQGLDFREEMKELSKIFEQSVETKSYFYLINTHLNLYDETKDIRIIKTDLNFLKSKLGGIHDE